MQCARRAPAQRVHVAALGNAAQVLLLSLRLAPLQLIAHDFVVLWRIVDFAAFHERSHVLHAGHGAAACSVQL